MMVEFVSAAGKTPLHCCDAFDTEFGWQLLLLQEGNYGVNAFSWMQGTQLHEAVRSNQLDIVETLLRLGADVNRKGACVRCGMKRGKR